MPYATEDRQGEGSSGWGLVGGGSLLLFSFILKDVYTIIVIWTDLGTNSYTLIIKPWYLGHQNLCTLVSRHHTLACSSWLQTSLPRFHVTKIRHLRGGVTHFVTLLHRASLFCTICHNSPLKWLLLMVNYCNFVEYKNDYFMIL